MNCRLEERRERTTSEQIRNPNYNDNRTGISLLAFGARVISAYSSIVHVYYVRACACERECVCVCLTLCTLLKESSTSYFV